MLTDTKIRNAKPREKPYKLFDGGGLHLFITPSGGRLWRFKYRYGGKERLLSIGPYPHTSAKAARTKHAEARRQLAEGIDPCAHKAAMARSKKLAASNSFEAIAREWAGTLTGGKWSAEHGRRVLNSLEQDVFPDLGKRPIGEIDAGEVLHVIRKVEKRGAIETAQRVLQRTAAVFRYAVQTARIKSNPCAELRGALQSKPQVQHRAALAAADLPEYFKNLNAYSGRRTTKLALRLLMLTFVRPGELRFAPWTEFDIKRAEWHIPGERMKMGAPHIVPLSEQALAVLEELRPLTGSSPYLFPGDRSLHKPMSENTLIYTLYRMGYHKRATAHGFRALASTVLNESGFNPDAVERQLAHKERNEVRAAYHRAEYLPERKKMMQWWADWLDNQERGGNVVTLKRKKN